MDSLDQTSQDLRGGTAALRCQVRIGAPFDFTARFGSTEELLSQLDAGELDVVIATQQIALRSLKCERLDAEEFVLVGAAGEKSYTLTGLTELERSRVVAQLSQRDWLSYSVELPIIRRFWQSVFGCRPDFLPARVIPNLHAIKSAVLLTGGISVLPRYLCQQELQNGRLPLLLRMHAPVRNELWLAYQKSKSADSTVAQVRRYLLPST